MNVAELFEQANTPTLLGSLLYLLDKASTRASESLVSTCLMRSIKASIHTPLVAWKLAATLSQSLLKCTDGFMIKNAARLEKLYDDAFIGISRELEISYARFFQDSQKVSLTKVLVLSYGDFALRMISINGSHQVKSTTFSAFLSLLAWPQREILSYSGEPSVTELHRGFDTISSVCTLLIRLQKCAHVRTLLRSRAAELRTACFSIIVAATYAHSSLSNRRINDLISTAASLFSFIILSLENKSIRYEAGAEVLRMLIAFKCIVASRLFENVELSILDGYSVISSIGRVIGVSPSAACINFWKDHPVLGNIRFGRFLHNFAHTCSLFFSLCITSALSLPFGLSEYEILVGEQISPPRNDVCHDFLYPIAGFVEILITCSKILLEKLMTTSTFNDLAAISANFLLACTTIVGTDFGLFNGLKAALFWPIAQLFTVPADALTLIKPQLYNCVASFITGSSLTFPIDDRLHNERFHSFVTVIFAMHQDFLNLLPANKGSNRPSRGSPESAKLLCELCKSGSIRLLAAYAAVFQDAGCPLLTDIILICFRIVSMLSHNSREKIVIRDGKTNDHAIGECSYTEKSTNQQMKLSVKSLTLYTRLLEGLAHLSLIPINGRLSSALPLTVHFLEVALTDRLLEGDHLQRITSCHRLLSAALLPITPLTYLYGVQISSDLKLAYGITDSSEISLESMLTMAGNAPLTEPGLKQHRPGLLPYLPIISIGENSLRPCSDDDNDAPSDPSLSIGVPSVLATPCITEDISVVSSTPALTSITGLGAEHASTQSLKSVITTIDSVMMSTQKQPEAISKDNAAVSTALILDSSEDD
ncbi:Hypothetical protein GSB_150950 [Giardia duodenalis]|uniref:Uncharacterized protein n=1 Tax=Giardia intestinalis TaxID=5741 RepID=V6U871_GIAIN|nr:Hypothetical protein GSB_150950 [Giardia intestinalis]